MNLNLGPRDLGVGWWRGWNALKSTKEQNLPRPVHVIQWVHNNTAIMDKLFGSKVEDNGVPFLNNHEMNTGARVSVHTVATVALCAYRNLRLMPTSEVEEVGVELAYERRFT